MIRMCITEYDEEKTFELFRREEREAGREEGREEERRDILAKMKAVGISDEMIRAILNPD